MKTEGKVYKFSSIGNIVYMHVIFLCIFEGRICMGLITV